MALFDFRVGLQLADNRGRGGFGPQVFTSSAESGNQGFTPFVGDSNRFDPDAVRLILDTNQFDLLDPLLDFRIVAQAADRGGTSQFGIIQATPWASQGGGISGFITDINSFDPDVYRLAIQTRPWSRTDVTLEDFRLGIQLDDNNFTGTGTRVFTPFASQGGGPSVFATDSNAFDFDGFTITLDVELEPV